MPLLRKEGLPRVPALLSALDKQVDAARIRGLNRGKARSLQMDTATSARGALANEGSNLSGFPTVFDAAIG